LGSDYLVKPGESVRLSKWKPGDTRKFSGGKKAGHRELRTLKKKMTELQEKLYAEHKHALLVVLQGMDASGKDGTIRAVFEGVDPQGVRVAKFGPPTPEENDHDFLWRVHKQTPAKGEIVIFNRSHYESVLVERVHNLVPPTIWKKRYDEINAFEELLYNEGTTILKFFLHIDKKNQTEGLADRLTDPAKHWKFSVNDIAESRHWEEYTKAYEETLERTSTDVAPWYVVPSDHAWYRDLVVCGIIVQTLESFGMSYPPIPAGKKPQL
jgi:PPK2 family polyphosphate:nucleotide phosphotransferase